jgi:molecular chaperone GrpE
MALAELATEAVLRLEREAAEWKDRALRAAADLENFRKRAARERDDALARGQAEVLLRVLDVVDDLARVAHLDPEATSAQALHEGMLQIERKFLRVLEAAGVERLDPVGAPFDPQVHEAVTMMPASAAEADQTVGTVFQHGYRLRGTLLRPARVAVLRWSGEPSFGSGSGGADA